MSEPTTPRPLYSIEPGPANLVGHMLTPERLTYRAAALRALKLYPGPIGALVARELRALDEFGFRIANDSLLCQVRDQIEQEWRASPLA